MPEELSVTSEELKAHIGSMKDLYKTQPQTSFSAIIMGLFGVGKTSLICTGPKPWLIDSFDPKGTVVLELKYADEIEKGNLIIRKFWNEDHEDPTEYMRWEEQHKKDISTGFLNLFGTYAIDSFTTWLDAAANKLSVYMKRDRMKQKLARNDYNVIYDQAKSTIKKCSSFDCNFIVTAHLTSYSDEDTGRTTTEIKAYKGLRTDVPLLFTEKYVLETEEAPPPVNIKYKLFTRAAGTFRASTQLGTGGKLKDIEEPDLREILRKVGFNYEDKPSIFEVLK